MSKPSGRVFVHVGVPKSGTTFLQGTLAAHRKELRSAGVLYPESGKEPMFRAALDVRRMHKDWGRKRKDVEGTWEKLCRKARAFEGTSVISHELLAGASAREAKAALSLLRYLDVHVVVTARDLARQVTAEWQESIKHGRRVSFEEFRARIMSERREHKHAQRFWASQHLPEVLARWGAELPAEKVHLVCCPPPESEPAVLWRRFADVVGFDPTPYESSLGSASNSSLGVTQIHLLRRVNTALDRRLVQPEYGKVVKQYFAKRLLLDYPSPRPQLPRELYDGLVELSTEWVKAIDKAGYTVHGDLQSLVPAGPAPSGAHPDDVAPEVEAETAAGLIADLLVEVARLRA
jgi:hypothetical protein